MCVLPGQETSVDDTSASPAQGEPERQRNGDAEPEVTTDLDGDVATLTLGGELTEGARRPLVRTMTDLMLGRPDLRRVRLDLRAATYLNSAGMAVLVQLQKLGQPRGVDVVLVAPPAAVARALQISGLWLRFPVEEYEAVEDDRVDREGGPR
jgi:stage II sporulation protein AA (anti-sigma F factor antagonist)